MYLDDFFEDINYSSKYTEWSEDLFIQKLKEFDKAYYTEGSIPLIEDSEYDKLYYYAKSKFENNEYFQENIGSLNLKGDKFKHKYIIGSLKKFKGDKNSSDFIEKWLDKINNEEDIIITPKFDGLSIYAEYVNGKLSSAATRGDGILGTNITDKAKLFLPLELIKKDNLHIRGEILLLGDIFKELGKANRRNAASGIIGTDSNENAHKLSAIFYEIINSNNCNLNNISDQMDYLKFQFKNNTSNYIIEKKKNIDVNYLINLLNKWKKDFEDKFDLDGLVLVISKSIRENVKLPSNKVAFKFGDEEAIGVVGNIIWQTSRTGKVVPIVEFEESILLSGAKIFKATGYNAGFIRDNKIEKGKKVKIIRSGSIIPKIIEVF